MRSTDRTTSSMSCLIRADMAARVSVRCPLCVPSLTLFILSLSLWCCLFHSASPVDLLFDEVSLNFL
eukprot:m.48566 g.48566  ORF g.48566 m.48566 type:complete len:67 (-) comp12010_c0_seq1:60-260(-)